MIENYPLYLTLANEWPWAAGPREKNCPEIKRYHSNNQDFDTIEVEANKPLGVNV